MEQAVLFALGALGTHYMTQRKLESRHNVVAGFGQAQNNNRQALMPAYPAFEHKLNQATDASILNLIDPDELNALRYNARYTQHRPGMDWAQWRANQLAAPTMGVDLTGGIPQ